MSDLPAIPLWALRAALEASGAPPRRRHGQHFLQDANLLAAMVRDAGVGPEDVVLEIGPGPGLLTRHLLATGARVRAVEIDVRVEAAARRLIEGQLQERLEWTDADALDGPGRLSAALRARLPGCTRMVANLPYNVAAPLIVLLLEEPEAPDHLVVMIQAEMGQRILAAPGSRNYGGLSVVCALLAEGRIARRVPPEAFWPAPKVASVILDLHRRPDRPAPAELAGLQRFVGLAFHARRKTLCNSVAEQAGLASAEVASALGLQENLQKGRAEAFSPLQFRAMAQLWAAYAPGERHRP
jgi:16S rRNA (adenine1518-N6/adenine1519-N6)-dimethyltransferase